MILSIFVLIIQVDTVARLSISEAIKQSGVARSTFYNKYIKKGLISVSLDNGTKYIDSSELVRVFPQMSYETNENNTEKTTKDTTIQAENNLLKMEVKLLRESLEKTEEDKQWLKDQNANLLLRLEAPKKVKNPIARWWNSLGDN